MKLYALVDFPDDSLEGFTPKQMDEFNRIFSEYGISRMYFQYYGNRDYGWHMNCDAPGFEGCKRATELMPNYSRVFVEAAKKYGMQTSAVMRPHEMALWTTYSPYYKDMTPYEGVTSLGGKMLCCSEFVKAHPEMRIKRRSYDVDPNAKSKTVAAIRLLKQNDLPFRFGKEDVTVYTSADNSYYKPYKGDFTLSESVVFAESDVYLAKDHPYRSELLTKAGAPIRALTIEGLNIDDQFIAVGVRTSSTDAPENRFVNVPRHAIEIYDALGNKITATPGGNRRGTPLGVDWLDAGFNFDDGFGAFLTTVLDPDGKEGFFAIAKGKNEYVHGALCESESAVREYWLSLLEQALEDGYDFVGNRIECHSVHVDEPFAYGFNDCIKEEYFRRFGKCEESEMDPSKIAKLRGDAYTELFIEAARRIRARGRKVYLTLNVEMLHNPIPLDRLYAYPMNVEWQWKRWLEEIKPDEINFRLYKASIDFLLNDPQCVEMIETAKTYGVPMTVERYPNSEIVEEYIRLRDLEIFDAFILYETDDYLSTDGEDSIVLTALGKKTLPRFKELLGKK